MDEIELLTGLLMDLCHLNTGQPGNVFLNFFDEIVKYILDWFIEKVEKHITWLLEKLRHLL